MWLYIVIGVIVSTLLAIRVYLSITMRFWRTQPVFHFYDWHYWWRPPGVITYDVDTLSRYYNPVHVRSFLIKDDADLSSLTVQRAVFLLQQFYLRHPAATYRPSLAQISHYLLHNNQASVFSVYELPQMLTEQHSVLGYHTNMVGLLTSRPLWVRRADGAKFAVYYVDNLCVHPDKRKQNVASDLIHTHVTQQRLMNPKIAVSLFKREGNMTHIVPLVTYMSTLLRLIGHDIDVTLGDGFQCLPFGKQTMSSFIAFVKTQLERFKWSILPDVSNINNLVKQGGYVIYIMRKVHRVYAVYVFRDHGLNVDNAVAMECIMCLKEPSLGQDTFLAGWLAAVQHLQKTHSVAHIWLEGLGDAVALQRLLNSGKGLTVVDNSPTAFFFYNYATHTVQADECIAVY
jgi:hypothetical protein